MEFDHSDTSPAEPDRRAFLKGLGVAAVFAPVAPAGPPTAPVKRKKADLEINRNGSQPSKRGEAEYFTGSVRIDAPFQGGPPARMSGATVTFEPSARTACHTHPLGQTLIVTAGLGWAQVEGGPVEEIRPGDAVWFPPQVKHWHGATKTTGVTHIASAEKLDGKAVDWLEKVTDEQYTAPTTK